MPTYDIGSVSSQDPGLVTAGAEWLASSLSNQPGKAENDLPAYLALIDRALIVTEKVWLVFCFDKHIGEVHQVVDSACYHNRSTL